MLSLVIGPPASGKGTVTQYLSDSYDLEVISVGNILKEEIAAETELGRVAKEYVEAGKLVPNGILRELLYDTLSSFSPRENLVIDGFPRNLEQYYDLIEILADTGHQLTHIVILSIDKETAMSRILNRVVCEGVGTTYNLQTITKEDVVACLDRGGSITRRADDSPEVLEQRWEIYEKETILAIEELMRHPRVEVLELATDTLSAEEMVTAVDEMFAE